MAVLCLLTNTPWPWPKPSRAASATVWEKLPEGSAEGRRKRIPGAARSFFHRLARARSRAPQQGLVSLLGAIAHELNSFQGISRQFQSTPPAWGATTQPLMENAYGFGFNPRPPRGGRPWRMVLYTRCWVFQSTPPAWGATDSPEEQHRLKIGFNPRPPRGGRRR
jgi:hypothetical protein